jgi:hypothetical protein
LPVVGLTVMVVLFAPVVVGLKVMLTVQVLPAARVEFAQPERVKSVESELESAVAPKMTGPPLAVKVTEEQALERPTVELEQLELPLAVK